MRGLAWDDVPQDLEHLKTELRAWGTELTIVDTEDAFSRLLLRETWDFVITDLVDLRLGAAAVRAKLRDQMGIKNAEKAAGRVPLVIILSGVDTPIDLREANLPGNVVLRDKNTSKPWLAGEIYQMCAERGLAIERSKVFLIYGRDARADGTTGKIESHLRARGLEIVKGEPGSFRTNVPQDLLVMMRPCAAFIAICTPDDAWEDGSRAPRGNVLFEMGVAVGLSRGLERLIIVQKWGAESIDRAVLPSDFGGHITLRFDSSCEHIYDLLNQRLNGLCVTQDHASPV